VPTTEVKRTETTVYCERCFFTWIGEGPSFGEAVALRHARTNPGHLVDVLIKFFLPEAYPEDEEAA